MTVRTVAGVLLVTIAVAGRADAQTIDRVRELYIAAAYEEALAAIPPAAAGPNAPGRTEIEQYRALCLLALGRDDEAIAVVERLVRSHPTFTPPPDSSPRVRVVFENARTRLVPDLARETYAAAKAAFDAEDATAARSGFTRTLELIDSLPETQRAQLSDLRLVASGFLDLSGAKIEATGMLPAGVGQPSEKPEPELPPVGALYTPPVAVREVLPVWVPPDSIALHTEYTGLVEIEIGADGRVLEIRVVKPSHPVYDAAVIRAARQWTYKPATRNGQPVASLKNIQLRLVPR
jgi:TonB family protein